MNRLLIRRKVVAVVAAALKLVASYMSLRMLIYYLYFELVKHYLWLVK